MWKECRDHYAKEEKVYRELKKELKKSNKLASHYVDKAIYDALSILKSRKRRAEKGQASPRSLGWRNHV